MSPKEVEALEFSFHCHRDQVDKQGKPYILHVLRVAFAVIERSSENVLIAALLHDVVEDCGIELDTLGAKYGFSVTNAIDHLTRRTGESYSAYIRRCSENAISRRVKLADLEDNLLSGRIDALEPKEAARLEKRYEKARMELESTDANHPVKRMERGPSTSGCRPLSPLDGRRGRQRV